MIFRPSGGLRYHLRARLYAKKWLPFVQAIDAWLERWDPPHNELLLLGSSAGYSLPRTWLKKFSKLHAFDLDPLAPWFFDRRGITLEFHAHDLFFVNGKLSLKPLSDVLFAHAQANVLFCNVLGQVPLEQPAVTEAEWLKYLRELRMTLTGRRWASYHDVYTLEPLPRARHEPVTAHFVKHNELVGVNGAVVIDHGTRSSWSEGLNKDYFGWSLTPKSLHIIEGIKI